LQYKEVWRWTITLVAIFGIWPLLLFEIKKKFKANIQSIQDSLDELKDLEE